MGKSRVPVANNSVKKCVVVQVLEHMSSQYKASYLEAEAKYNSAKNRFPDKLPSEYALHPPLIHTHTHTVCSLPLGSTMINHLSFSHNNTTPAGVIVVCLLALYGTVVDIFHYFLGFFSSHLGGHGKR